VALAPGVSITLHGHRPLAIFAHCLLQGALLPLDPPSVRRTGTGAGRGAFSQTPFRDRPQNRLFKMNQSLTTELQNRINQ